ncbi:hypothetical protein NMS_0344 [Nonlabens marinus S1-08]|uniref:Uncharacterized protein n=1 Tax=Nonlabens marinus S1-08 TaxID=1454201 RepID=W8VU74_9FLAO|nr:hypothetical protein NMS_0344 [Nonlabens marinus S1-08]
MQYYKYNPEIQNLGIFFCGKVRFRESELLTSIERLQGNLFPALLVFI